MPHMGDDNAEGSEAAFVFPPVTKDHIQNCSYDAWFPKYRSSCIKSRIIPLPVEFVSYLHEDGIVLADDSDVLGEAQDDEWQSSGATTTNNAQQQEAEDSDDDEPSQLPPNERFPDTHNKIKETIEELGGAVAPKLNWSSPKDAKWISAHQNTLKCTSPNDIYLLLKSSSFISHDLLHAFDGCTAPEPTRPFKPILVLRPYFTPHVALEFRCFIKHRQLIAISQRDLNHYNFLTDLRPNLWRKITKFYTETLRHTFPDSSFTFDIYVPENSLADDGLGNVRLMDINPWAIRTDALLFSWEELLQQEVARPLIGPPAGADAADMSGGDTTSDELDDETSQDYSPDRLPELRIVEKDDPGAYNFSTPQYSAHKLPKEVVDASLAGEGGLREFAQQWKDITEGRGGNMWEQPGAGGARVQFTYFSPHEGLHVLLAANMWLVRSQRLPAATSRQIDLHDQGVALTHTCCQPHSRTVNKVSKSLDMPSRPRQSKVTKPNGSVRNRKSLSNTAQQELEHNYAVTNGSSNGHGPIENPASIGSSQLALPQSSPLPGVGGSDNFNFTSNQSVYPLLMTRKHPSAAEIAYSKYGHAVKIDSALSKKVAAEAAKRPPAQRRPDQKLNIERRSNLEAFLAHITGQVAEKACKNCYKGHGPWTECVVYDGQMCGSCTNCWYNASGSRCTFHGTTTPIASVETPAAPPSRVVVEGSEEAGGSTLPYFTPPNKEDDIKPIMDWTTPQQDNESTTSSQTTQLHGPEPLPVPPTAYMDFQSSPMAHGLPSMGLILSGTQDVAPPCFNGTLTQQLIHQAMGDVARLTRKDRYMARIESAAEELALRVAEYNDYLRTPEGVAEMHNQLRRHVPGNTMPPGHAHDACMETMETESAQDSGMS